MGEFRHKTVESFANQNQSLLWAEGSFQCTIHTDDVGEPRGM